MKKSILIVFFVIVLIGVIIGISFSPRINEELMSGDIGLNGQQTSGEDAVIENKPVVGVAIPGWNSIKIPKDVKEVSVDFMNPLQNKDLYYLTFELRLLNNSELGYEVLYTSDLIEPGDHVKKISLSRGVSEGEYDAVVRVQPYKMDVEKTPTNNVDMKTKLIVK